MTKSTRDCLVRPRIGVVGLAFPGYHLGEELSTGKMQEMQDQLRSMPVEVISAHGMAMDEAAASKTGDNFARAVFNHTIEKTDAKRVAGKVSVSVKSNTVSTYRDREDFLCLTWPLMGGPNSPEKKRRLPTKKHVWRILF